MRAATQKIVEELIEASLTTKAQKFLEEQNPLVNVLYNELGNFSGIVRLNVLVSRHGWIKVKECEEVFRLLEATENALLEVK